jgi:hypothetical protein
VREGLKVLLSMVPGERKERPRFGAGVQERRAA